MNATDGARMMTEEIQVAGSELIERVKALLNEGRVRHIKVKSPNGDTFFELPLAVGVVGGAALALASPFLAMAAALAGMLSSFKIEIVREPDAAQAIEHEAKASAEKAWEAATTVKPTATRAPKGAKPAVKKAAAKAPARTAASAKRVGKAAKAPTKAARGKTERKTKATGRR